MNIYAGSTVKLNDLRLNANSTINFIGNSTVSITQVDHSTFDSTQIGYNDKTFAEGLYSPFVNTYGAIVVNGSYANIGLYGENSISNDDSITSIGFRSNTWLNVNVGGYFEGTTYAAKTNYLPTINAVANAGMTVNFGKNPAGEFTISSIESAATSGEFALELKNFYNDFLCFEVDYSDKIADGAILLDSGLSVYLSGTNSDGGYLSSDWTVVERNGMFFLNNSNATSAIPEPSTFAFIFAIMALGLAYYRKR